MPYTTQQKSALAEAIMKAERPLTPDEICQEVQKEIPHLGRATVYRALKQFVEEGQVRLVEIPGVPTHYESAARQHHHFFSATIVAGFSIFWDASGAFWAWPRRASRSNGTRLCFTAIAPSAAPALKAGPFGLIFSALYLHIEIAVS